MQTAEDAEDLKLCILCGFQFLPSAGRPGPGILFLFAPLAHMHRTDVGFRERGSTWGE